MTDILYKQSPALWSVEVLTSHGHQVVTDLARDAAASSSTMRYLLGRCMLAMERLGTHKEMGLSSPVHFATQHLKTSENLAKTVFRVSRQLENLPLLALAVLHAEIEWSQIREVASVATPETEEMWRKLCIELNCKQIQILVAATPKGGVPGEVASKLPRKTSEYRCRFQPEVVVLIERGLQKMSRKLDKPIMFREAVERFFTEFLADKPYDEAAEKMLEEARKDFLAGRIQQVAREFGLLEEVEESGPGESRQLTQCEETAESLGLVETEEQSGIIDQAGAEARVDVEEFAGFTKQTDLTARVGLEGQAGFENRVAVQSRPTNTPSAEPPSLVPLSRDSLSLDSLSQEDSLKASALQALGDLQQAIGGSFSWEAWENSWQPPTEFSHVGKPNPDSTTSPRSAERDTPHPRQEDSQDQPERPTSKVTRLNTPFQGQPNRSQFQPQAPALLNELMAHLKFNPNSRFPTKAQRKALLRRDRYCCRTPGCTNHLFLEIHHIKRYSQGGKTLPELLLTLCSRCHKNTEEGKLFIRLTDTGQLIFTDQHGYNLEDIKRRERAIWLDYWLGWKGKETDSHWARAVGFSESVA